jgi:hypothetical protein
MIDAGADRRERRSKGACSGKFPVRPLFVSFGIKGETIARQCGAA